MERKPWPILLLGCLHLLEPVYKVLFQYIRFGIGPVRIFHLLGGVDRIAFFFAFPIAGFAILAFRKWSYPVFLLIQAFTLYDHFHHWRMQPTPQTTVLFALFNILNLGIVSYFLLPAVRAPYVNPKLRWWESKPRYSVDWKIQVSDKESGGSWLGQIRNFSEGGVFMTLSETLTADQSVEVEFTFQDATYHLLGKIVHATQMGGKTGYGLQFSKNNTPESLKNMKLLARQAESLGLPCLKPKVDRVQDFLDWAKGALTRGEGLVPVLKSGKKSSG